MEYTCIKPALAEKFRRGMTDGRIIFFSAACGFGKSTAARELLKGKNVLSLSAADMKFALPDPEKSWDVLLIDDLQYIRREEDQQALVELIRDNPQRRFVLLSRALPPGWVLPFRVVGLMTTLDSDDLLFDRETTTRYLKRRGVDVSEQEITAIQKETMGYPLGVALAAGYIERTGSYNLEARKRGLRELFDYYDAAIYRRFDLPVRRFLLELAPFESFNIELARMVSGNSAAGEMLEWLRLNTSMLRYDGDSDYHFWDVFRDFLLWEMEREYTDDKRRALFDRGGLYFELRGDDVKAIECYSRGGEHSKVCEILARNALRQPSHAHYTEMEKYYLTLPEEEILASPELMQGMCMLCALTGKYEESERWYGALRTYAKNRDGNDAARRSAESRLVWLDISLPQRSVGAFLAGIPRIFRMLTQREIELPPISATSMMPSLMNGGKDFSDWSGKDDLLYKTLRKPVEAILGRDGVGMADCALAESKFEKGEDISKRILALVSRLGDVQRSGTPDMEFAIVGLLARKQLDDGQTDETRRTLTALRRRFEEQGQDMFLPNVDAALCRLSIFAGDMDAADEWYRTKAPRNVLSTNVLLRYQYITQAMVELAQGRSDAALLTLAPLEEYCRVCARHIDAMQLYSLRAIALYRLKDRSWRRNLTTALKEAEKYTFIRPISRFGAAVLPLLEKLEWEGDGVWFKKLCAAVRDRAAKYPDAFRSAMKPGEALTATEMQVLRLICADKSNADICQVLDIKLPTVKSHVSHILQKLGVSRRAEARAAAKKLWLIPEDDM